MVDRAAPPEDPQTTHAVPQQAGAHALVERFWLVVVKGPDAGATFTSEREQAVIGTHESADFVLHDETVSRFHCEIALSAGGPSTIGEPTIRDLGSKNRTVVDGVSVLHGHLREGSVLTLGLTEIRFELRSDKARVALSEHERFGVLVGKSGAMRRVFSLLERCAPTDATVLIEGETGTGKELVAESIHRESKRKDGPFVVVDCGAIPPDLLESELFGHERGAFTGASAAREGAFEAASGGTIFLDEIGELALDLQPKLLRALERKAVKRVGSNQYLPADVRVVAATNRNLRGEVNEKKFRSDLYYRLAVVQVRLPPLRERLDDLPMLVDSILIGLDAPGSPELVAEPFLEQLARHGWPGNVRELRNYLERCLALRQTAALDAEPEGAPAPQAGLDLPFKIARERCIRAFEKAYVEAQLAKTGGNVTDAARAAGVDRIYFYRMLWRHGLR